MPKKQKRRKISETKQIWAAASQAALSPATLGIAHDLNNSLTGVYSIADLCLHELKQDEPIRERIEMILQNGQNAVQLVQRLFREHSAEIGREEYHDLNQLVTANVELIRWATPKSIEIRKLLAAQQLPIFVDAVEFRTICLKLVLSATAGIEGRSAIEIETGSGKKDLKARKSGAQSARSGTVFLRIAGPDCPSPRKRGKRPTNSVAGGPDRVLAYRLLSEFAEKYSGKSIIEVGTNGRTLVTLQLPRARI